MIKTSIITVTSAAGGVGKTTVAMNLAAYLTGKKKKVLLVDFSLYGGMDVILKQSKRGQGLGVLYSLYEQDKALDLDKALVKDEHILACDILIGAGPMVMEKVNSDFTDKLLKAIRLKSYDYVIFDTSCELAERHAKLLQMSDKIIYMLNQDMTQAWRSMKHLEILDKLQVERSRIQWIFNRWRKDIIFSQEDLENELSIKCSGHIKDCKGRLIELNNKGKIPMGQVNGFTKKLKNLFKVLVEV